MNQRKAIRIIVRGRVQRVGFRVFVRDVAHAFDIRGWVRNHEEGSVRIHAEGDEENLRSFIEQVEIGPPASRVDDLELETLAELKGETIFSIVS